MIGAARTGRGRGIKGSGEFTRGALVLSMLTVMLDPYAQLRFLYLINPQLFWESACLEWTLQLSCHV
jgi:hypothetical protein